MVMNLINPFMFASAAPAPPATLVYAEGWHGLANGNSFPWPRNTEITSNGITFNGRVTGSRAMPINGSGSRSIRVSPPDMSGDWLMLSFASFHTIEAQAVIFAINRGATGNTSQSANTCARFRMETNGNLTVFDSAGATIGTITGYGDAWHWFDVKLNAVNSGSITVAMDGTTIIDNAAGDFAGSSATGNSWTLWFTDDEDSGSDNPNAAALGEIIAGYGSADAPLIGEHYANALRPNGIDSAGAWTANTGTLATATDEALHNGDTDYAASSTDTDEFLLTAGDLAGSPTVLAVKHCLIARRTTGSASVVPLEKSGSALAAGSGATVTTDYGTQTIEQFLPSDPNGGAAWTASALNALKTGARLTGSGDLRVTQDFVQAFVRV